MRCGGRRRAGRRDCRPGLFGVRIVRGKGAVGRATVPKDTHSLRSAERSRTRSAFASPTLPGRSPRPPRGTSWRTYRRQVQQLSRNLKLASASAPQAACWHPPTPGAPQTGQRCLRGSGRGGMCGSGSSARRGVGTARRRSRCRRRGEPRHAAHRGTTCRRRGPRRRGARRAGRSCGAACQASVWLLRSPGRRRPRPALRSCLRRSRWPRRSNWQRRRWCLGGDSVRCESSPGGEYGGARTPRWLAHHDGPTLVWDDRRVATCQEARSRGV